MFLVFSEANRECISGTVASQGLCKTLCRLGLGERRTVSLRNSNAGVRAVQFCALAKPGHIAGSAVGKRELQIALVLKR